MSLTIRQYALLFAMLILMLIGSFAYQAYQQFHETRNNIETSQQASAKKELLHAISMTTSALQKDTLVLATWEEIHQQIDSPAFFAYWHTNRLRQSTSRLQDYLSDLMIYDVHGRALAQLKDIRLPEKIDTEMVINKPFRFLGNGEMIYSLPVYQSGSIKNIIGYLSVRTNLLSLTRELNHFYYINPDSLKLKNELFPLSAEVIKENLFEYGTIKTGEILQLEEQLFNSMIKISLVIILPALLLYGILTLIIGVPINSISSYIEHLRHKPEYATNIPKQPFFQVKELKTVFNSLYEYHCELYDTHAILDEKNRALWNQAHHDALTGAYNRRAFDDQWRNLKDLLTEHRVNVCFMLFDVDLFKSINDTYGHQVGDDVLNAIVSCINSAMRKGEHLFRLGGDEFATFLIDCDAETALDVAKRCAKAIERYPFERIGMLEPVRLSIGISIASGDSPNSFDNLQWQADAAMYTAKRPGKDDIVIFSDEMREDSKGILSSWLSNTVYQAIDKGTGLVLHYQPIVDFKNYRIRYYEALVRIYADGELIHPGSIFNVVEARRFEVEMDRAVIRQLIVDMGNGKIPKNTGVSINLSGPTITQPKLSEWLTPLQKYTRDFRVVLEVTETALITELKRATENLKHLQDMGFTIALDDFGSGYSSIKYLASMPVDVVKFDITLIQTLYEPKQRKMMSSLAHMIEEAGHKLVAEGIETDELLKLVIETGFHYGQGYLFGKAEAKPIPKLDLDKIALESVNSPKQLSLH